MLSLLRLVDRFNDLERELPNDWAEARLVLTVADDGVGFDPAAAEVRGRRLGLTSMEERARALGGTLRIDSTPGEGTRVRLEVAR